METMKDIFLYCERINKDGFSLFQMHAFKINKLFLSLILSMQNCFSL
jgi:hypothetical protein